MVSVGSASCFAVAQIQPASRRGETRNTMHEAKVAYSAAVPLVVSGLNVYVAPYAVCAFTTGGMRCTRLCRPGQPNVDVARFRNAFSAASRAVGHKASKGFGSTI